MMRDLGTVSFGAALDAQVADGVESELAEFDQPDVVRRRDEVLIELLRLKAGPQRLP